MKRQLITEEQIQLLEACEENYPSGPYFKIRGLMDSSIHLQSFTMSSKTLTFPHALDVTDLVGKPVTITGIIEQSPTNEKLFEVMCFRMADKNGNLNNILKNE